MANQNDLRFIRTNQLLCDSFTDLLQQKKFDDITVGELCNRALVRRATFYTHFIDKYDFFAYYISQKRDTFKEDFVRKDDYRAVPDMLTYLFGQLISYLKENKTMVRNTMNSSAFPILLDILSKQIRQDVIEEYAACGITDYRGLTAETIASFFSGGIIQIVRQWITGNFKMPEEELNAQFITLADLFSGTNPQEHEQVGRIVSGLSLSGAQQRQA